jgi:hypothetical protein
VTGFLDARMFYARDEVMIAGFDGGTERRRRRAA